VETVFFFMLTAQKRYLYCLYLMLSLGCGTVFGLIELLLLPLLKNSGAAPSLTAWLIYYLLPAFILLTYLSRRLWFGGWRRPADRKLPLALALAAIVAILGCTGTYYYYIEIPFLGSYLLTLAMLPVLKKELALMVEQSGPESNLVCSVLIIGAGRHARKLSQKIANHPEWGMRVTGFLADPDHAPDPALPVHRILGPAHSLGQVLNQVTVDMVLLAPGEGMSRHVDPILQRCRLEGIDAGFVTKSAPSKSTMTDVEQLADLRLRVVRFVKRAPEKLFVKRCIDLTASMAACCLCLPVWLIVPALIRMDSPGPILFRQTRVGKNGRRFTMLKFRSMVVDAESRRESLMHLNEMDGPAFKMKEDPRVTKIGAVLRKTSLDELPQLFNVIRGDISLVGPRPPLAEEVRQYRPWEKKRLSVPQGITGLWQISGRNDIKFDEWMKLDLMYIDQWRLPLDLLILVKTIPAVVARKGAQ
jgi:exopolysaccharide biosynthesis polyprenyl glycosylphosphotransferase